MKVIRKNCNITILFASLILSISIISCKPEIENDILFTGDKYKNIMQFISTNADYSSFEKIVKSGKMYDALSSYNSNGGIDYTLFLPTNDAVAKFISENESYSTMDALLQDADYCSEIVKYHLVNGRIPSTDFPNGALANKTISNYFLTIFFREIDNVITYAVNDESKITVKDIKLNNGTIHIIDKMLTPVVYTSYQWVEKNTKFSIFSELLSKCGLSDTLNAYGLDQLGRKVYNEYTLIAESDSLYGANAILSFNDLVSKIYSTGVVDQDFTNQNNLVNKYARYHVIEKSVFLDEFKTDVYNTYGDSPISVDLDGILKFNTGTKNFDSITTNNVKTYINYIQIDLGKSNIVSRSGAIHQLNQVLYPFIPSRKAVTFEFYEEPIINTLSSIEGDHIINIADLKNISLVGLKSFNFINSSASLSGVLNTDYLKITGNFDFIFKTPKILAGRYTMKLVVNRGDVSYASIQTKVDNQNVGVILNLTDDTSGFKTVTLGTVEFWDFNSRTVKLSTIIPGTVLIDRIIFEPI